MVSSSGRLGVARVSAVVTVVAAVPLLAMSMSTDSYAWAWSLGVAAVLFLGGCLLCAQVPVHSVPRSGPVRSVMIACVVGGVLAAGSLIGGVTLWHLPWLSSWVAAPVEAARDEQMWLIIPATLLAGAAEEIFFRLGLPRLFRGRSRWFWPLGTYVVVTAFTGSVGLAVMAAVLGAVAMWSLDVTGRWFVPVIVHGIWTLVMIGVFPVMVS